MAEDSQNLQIHPNIRESLKSLGFTDYYINIYIGLIQNGEQNAHDLSKVTKVPYSRIYEVLNDMNKRNIITKMDGRPSTFLANEPDSVFKNLKKIQEAEFEENVHMSLPYLNQIFGGRQVKKLEFVMYEGMKACLEHVRNVINPTARKLHMAIGNIGEILPLINNNLDFMYTKQVTVHLLICETESKSTLLDYLNGNVQIRTLPKIHQNLLISDDHKAMEFLKGHFDIAKPTEQDYTILTSNNPLYVSYVSELFSFMWKDAPDLAR